MNGDDLLEHIHAAHSAGYELGYAAGQMAASIELAEQVLHRRAAKVTTWAVGDMQREGMARREEHRRIEQRTSGAPYGWISDPYQRERARREAAESFWVLEDAAIATGQGQLHPWLHRGFKTEADMRRHDAELGRAA